MPVVISVDLGTTKITSLAIDTESEAIICSATTLNDANTTTLEDRQRGRSEWNATRILSQGLSCLKLVTTELASRTSEIVGIGITGQQHGVVLTNSEGEPRSPLINWQDRRALDTVSGSETFLDLARRSLGSETWLRTGCHLQPGFMAVSLRWMKHHNILPAGSLACFIMDCFGSALTGQKPVTEPSCAGSSGVFNVITRNWDDEAIRDLELSRDMFPEVREANQSIGQLTQKASSLTGIPAGTPVFAPIGDHQASFLGCVSDLHNSVLVNVGTGAQVAVYTNDLKFLPPIELRPFPCGGNLLSNVGLAGGWSYQVLENFFRDVGTSMFSYNTEGSLYEHMNRLAATVDPGADGLRCEPLFNGTRLDPRIRGSISGLSPQNFTARHFSRAILEGMAQSLRDGYTAIQSVTGRSQSKLIAAGNGLRENQLLAEIVSTNFGLPILWSSQREEAAMGAARCAMIGLGIRKSVS